MDDDFKQTMENDLMNLTDGTTVEFYLFFWSKIRILLHKAFKKCISNRHLSATMKHDVIMIIPKANKRFSLLIIGDQ